jgi:transcriptional regulator with XRE-family HTH domain
MTSTGTGRPAIALSFGHIRGVTLLTQDEFAAQLGISSQSLSAIEHGRSVPRLATLEAVAAEVTDELEGLELDGDELRRQRLAAQAEELARAADASFEQLSSVSHRAAAWLTQGDLAAHRGDDHTAARLYRRAAEALQDFRF